MGNLEPDGQELSARQQYRTLLAVSQAIVSQRDLRALLHELADRLHQVARFDYLSLVLHEAASTSSVCCAKPAGCWAARGGPRPAWG
jgi:transcriptional regulator with GAF, ATPase, and Fis domain